MSSELRKIEVRVNGAPRQVPEGRTVLQLLDDLEIPAARVAVELNRNILKRQDWEDTQLGGGDELEIVHFVGGG